MFSNLTRLIKLEEERILYIVGGSHSTIVNKILEESEVCEVVQPLRVQILSLALEQISVIPLFRKDFALFIIGKDLDGGPVTLPLEQERNGCINLSIRPK